MDEISKLMGKKPKTKMSPEEIQAKMETVMELLTMAQEAMGDQVKGGMQEMMKPEVASVEVSAADPEDLEEGLETAQDLVAGDDEEMPEAVASTEEESDEDEENPFKKKKKPLFDMF